MPNPQRLPAVAITASAASLAAVATVAAVPGSPLLPPLLPGVEPSGPFAALARALGLDAIHGSALVSVSVIVVTLAGVTFLVAVREAWRGRVSLRAVAALVLAVHVAVLTLPLLVSRDVYSYMAYGRIAALHHANPYVVTPSVFPCDPIAAVVGPKWFAVPSVYGPLFTTLSAGLVRAVGGLQAEVDAFRALAAAASLGTIALILWVARRLFPARAAFAVAAFGLNPVVVFQSVGSAHNDLLVALAVAGALALVVSGRDGLAVVTLALGALVKATAALPLLLLLVWIVARRPAGARLRALLFHAGLAAATGVVFAAPYLQLRDPTLGMAELAGHEGWLAPSRLFRRLFDAVSGHTLGWLARAGFAALFLVVLIALVRWVASTGKQTGPAGLGAAWGWALVASMLLAPLLLPWYVAWALPLLFLLPRVPRGVLLATSAALSVSQWVAEPERFRTAYDANVIVGHYAITPLVVIALVVLLLDLRRRLAARAPLGDEPNDISATARKQ